MVILALYNNTYSRELLRDYLKGKKYILINIGMTNHKDSIYCGSYSKNTFFDNLILFKKIIKEIKNVNHLIVPNQDNVLCNLLMKHYRYVKISQVAEGTLNYHKQDLFFNTIIKSFVKFLLCLLKFNFYNPFFLNKVNHIQKNDGYFICRYPKNLFSGNEKKIIIPRDKVSQYKSKNLLLIIGQHMNKKKIPIKKFMFFDDLIKQFKIPFEQIIYIPHPRCINNPVDLHIYKSNVTLIDKSNVPAIQHIFNYQPKCVITLGGSTTFMEIYEYNLPIEMIAFGCQTLIQNGFYRYRFLNDLFKDLDVKFFH